MPLLELEEDGLVTPSKSWGLFHVACVMLAPDDERLRSELMLHFMKEEVSDSADGSLSFQKPADGTGSERLRLETKAMDPALIIEHRLLRFLKRARDPQGKSIEKEIDERHSAGSKAGLILAELLSRRLQGQKVSSDAAINRVADPYGQERTRGTKTKTPALRKIWGQFRPVAHFWLARDQLAASLGEPDNSTMPCELKDMPRFLVLSEAIREQGEVLRYDDDKRRRTALPVGETWRLPNEIYERLAMEAPDRGLIKSSL